MLESLAYPGILWYNLRVNTTLNMPSKNFSGAGNQQERLEICWWIVGIVDGEGSFLVNIFKSPKTKMGWQVFPEFNVSQSEKDIVILKELKKFFGCGHIYPHRSKNRKKNWDTLYKYCVREREDLEKKIIPFFQNYPPKSLTKRRDFKAFMKSLKLIRKKNHLTIKGMKKIIEETKTMTHRKPFNSSRAAKFLKSSETIRRNSTNRKSGKI